MSSRRGGDVGRITKRGYVDGDAVVAEVVVGCSAGIWKGIEEIKVGINATGRGLVLATVGRLGVLVLGTA